ncbi:MAG: flippase-like domain-containing protein [Gammaproteobacteria bacterium]|nr:flippase-like domain-containing protein [Gammaproteobacteria bacterium]
MIVLSFVVWAAWYVYFHHEEFLAIKEVSWFNLMLLYGAFLVIVAFNGKFIEVVSIAFDVRLERVEWLMLSAASSFANYFLPFRGGAGMRALYLAKVHGLSFTHFLATVGIMFLTYAVANGLLALIGMTLIVLSGGPVDVTLTVFFALVTIAGFVLMKYDRIPNIRPEHFLLKQLHHILLGWTMIKRKDGLILRLWLIISIISLASIWQCKVAFAAISVPLSWGGVILYAASKNMALLISLTPGSFGIVETISIYLGNVLGYTTAQALLVQALIRVVAISALLVIGPLAILFLKRRLVGFDRNPTAPPIR